MSEWKECKIGDVAGLVKDVYRPRKGDHLPYIGLEHIQEQGLRLLGIGDSDSINSNKFYFKPGDILFGKLRPYFRKVVSPKFEGVCSTDIWVVRALESNNQKFLYYFLANQEFVDTANSGDSGTRMPRADWNFVKDTIWRFPSLPEQRAIAAVLSSLDDKIDLLHRQNKTLESLAETLWRKMFAEVAEDNCNQGRVKDLINILPGYSFKSSDFVEFGQYRLVTIKNVQDGYLDLSRVDYLNKISQSVPAYCLLQNGDILFSLTGNVGRICLANEDNLLLNQRVAKIEAKNARDWAFVYIMFRQKSMRNLLEELAKGTAQANLSPIDTANMEMRIPSDKLLQQFSENATSFVKKVLENFSQIRTLSHLRDTLLPKLMNEDLKFV